MDALLKTIYLPVNRHYLIELIEEQEKKSEHNILLPEDYKPSQSEYATVRIIDWAADVKDKPTLENTLAIVERSMIKELQYKEHKLHLILENYILCTVYDYENA